jgi:HAE1 family hydrophobic/amphiphilic exporter-1
MEFPVLTVASVLPGASPEGMEEDVTDVLEERLNTIAGVREITSTSYQGVSQIRVEFELGTKLDVAAQEVRDKVALARVNLPPALEPPVVGTFDPNDTPVLWIPIKSNRSIVETSEAVRRQVNPFIETIPGVAGVAIFGRLDRNIRIWLDGDQLRARGLAAQDVLAALQREHVELPGGSVESERLDYSVKTDAEFRSVAELEGMVVAQPAGQPAVLLRDVARVEDGAEDVGTVARYNGEYSVGIGIRKQSGGNTVAIVDEVRKRLPQIEEVLPKGMTLWDSAGFIDFSKGVREAVAETEFSLVFGALLAVLTVFVFLRRSRPTFIIALAIPVSLIATFGLVYLAGFTLNTMTLLGMALAVGVVIDDAIVVLENIERHREGGANARDAASRGTKEIAFAATAATLSVAAVFLPVFFVQGLVGSFLRDFGLTVAGSVIISLFVALTLTPMLAARMPPPTVREHGSIYHRLEQGFGWLESRYKALLGWTLENRIVTVAIALAAFFVAIVLAGRLKTEFFPPSDDGIFFARIEAPAGSSVEATENFLEHDERWFLDQPELVGLFSAAGTMGGGDEAARAAQSNLGMLFGTLHPRKERKRSVMELVHEARTDLQQVPGRVIRIFNPSEMMHAGGGGGTFEVELRGNLALADLDRLAKQFIARLEKLGGFVDLNSSLKLGLPEVRIVPDREKAAALGIDARTVASAIQMMIGGMDVGVFKEAGRRYDIRMRLEPQDRSEPDSITKLYVRSPSTGQVVELRNLVNVETGAAPSAITRSHRQRSVTIGANLANGRALGESVADAQKIAAEILPEGVTLGLSGQAEAMAEGTRQMGLALGLGILVIYMVLAAQFESLVHPLTVMLALPLAMTGALGGLWITGNTLNLFSMIGILLLFGLVTKNSILLVDYANQLRRERGMDKVEAIRTAAPVRMRPVLMTAVAMIFGVLPAAFGIGPGAETRAPMAVASSAGMFSSMLLTLIVVPVFYLLFDDAAEWVKRGFKRLFGAKAPEAKPAEAPHPATID